MGGGRIRKERVGGRGGEVFWWGVKWGGALMGRGGGGRGSGGRGRIGIYLQEEIL